MPSAKLVRFGDVLINSTGIGTLGRVAQVYQDVPNCTVDSHVSIVRPNASVGSDYFGMTLLTLQAHFDHLGQGATGQTELARDRIAETEIRVPPNALQEQFGIMVGPMRQAINVHLARNANLRATRDLLLPKLISGEVDVSELDIDVGQESA